MAAPGDQILFLLAHSSERLVNDRIKNYLAKYLPTAQEVTDRDVLATGVKPGTPKYQKAREELILTHLAVLALDPKTLRVIAKIPVGEHLTR